MNPIIDYERENMKLRRIMLILECAVVILVAVLVYVISQVQERNADLRAMDKENKLLRLK